MEISKSRQVVLGGLMIALVFVATYTIRIPVPFTNGYIHAGDSMIFLAALYLGPTYGAIAGGIGSALSDLLGGYAHFVLPTFIIKSIMGYIVGWAGQKLGRECSLGWKIGFPAVVGLAWLGFILMMRGTINRVFGENPNQLQTLLGSESIQAVSDQVAGLSGQLIFIAVTIPIGLVVFALIANRTKGMFVSFNQIIAMALAGIWMVSGYYVAEIIMTGNILLPLFSLPWNVVQFVLGLIIAYVVYIGIAKTKKTN